MQLRDLENDKRFTLVGDNSGTVFLLDSIEDEVALCWLGIAVVHISGLAEIEGIDEHN